MFCGKCGFKCDDDAVFCTNCGAKVGGVQPVGNTQSVGSAQSADSAQPVGNAQPVGSARPARRNRDNGKEGGRNRNEDGSNRNRKVGILAVAIVAVCFIVAAIKIVTMFGGGGYEEPVEKFFEVISKADSGVIDIETYLEMYPKKIIENELEEYGYSMEEFKEEIRSDIRYQIEQIKNYKISYEILSAEKVTGAELDDVKDTYKDEGIRVSAAKNVRIVCRTEFRGNKKEEIQEIRVIKIKNSWYIDAFSFDGIS